MSRKLEYSEQTIDRKVLNKPNHIVVSSTPSNDQGSLLSYSGNNIYITYVYKVSDHTSLFNVIIQLFNRINIQVFWLFILAHIFFDDAFDYHSLEEFEYQANDYVKMMFACMDLAAR